MTNTLDGFNKLKVQQAMDRQAVASKTPIIPSLRLDDFDQVELLRYLRPIQRAAQKVSFGVGQLPALANDGYIGGVYSPTQNRIYFVPAGQAAQATWHYIDCETGEVVAYAHGLAGDTPVSHAYYGGVYSPTQNRIYFVPTRQGAPANTKWHYVDCNTGNVVAYTHGVTTVDYAYSGGVYSPTQNRIYFAPYSQADEANWHYIDCDDGSVVEYTNTATANQYGYFGAVYSPTQNRIYLVPYGQADETTWHYIDCDDGIVHAYTHGVTVVGNGYSGGVYSPTQNRIYLVPNKQAEVDTWHYVDCDTGSVVAYTHEVTAVQYAYFGGVYSPTKNRVYFVPDYQSIEANWHYVDCDTGNIVSYSTDDESASDASYGGGVYSPKEGKVYFAGYWQQNQPWHYIQEYSDIPVSRNLMAGALFNKF